MLQGAILLISAVLATATLTAGPGHAKEPPTCAGKPQGTGRRDRGDAPPELVRGIVLEHRTMRPCVGRIVVVGNAHTTTDSDGRFAIVAPSHLYDLAVIEPNRWSATFYRGLRRRDLLLIHEGDINLIPKEHERHAAHIDGKLAGAGFDPAASNLASVYFSSPQVSSHRVLANSTPEARRGVYGPLPLLWVGPETTAGTLVAIGTTHDKSTASGPAGQVKGPVVWWEADQQLEIPSGDAVSADLTLNRVAMGRIAGQVDVDPGLEVTGKSVSYVLPGVGIPLGGDGRDRRPGRFDFPVPDLRHLPGQYCASAYDSARGISSSTTKCGLSPGATDVTLRLRAPPKLTTIKADQAEQQSIARDTQFGWTAFEGGIHRLAIACYGGSERSKVFVYTMATRTSWPDLRAVDLAFPKVGDTCEVSVTGWALYRGMDEAFSPEGLGMHFPKETYSSRSLGSHVTMAPPGKSAPRKPAKQSRDDEPTTHR